MKKAIIITAIILSITAISLFLPGKNSPAEQTAETKQQVNFSVYSALNYSSAVYSALYVALHVTVTKEDSKNTETVYDEEFPSVQVQKLPSKQNAFKPSISITGNGSGIYNLTYTLTYKSNGSTLEISKNQLIGANSNNMIEIDI